MAEVHDTLTWTQSDAIAEVLAAESCHIVQSPPDYVRKLSRYLESSAGQSRQDKVSNEPGEAGSDSGDSLFITQKPVSEAVRSGRRRHYRKRSDRTSLEDSEGDTSSSSSHGESKTDQKSRRKKSKVPPYTFPFLSGRKGKPTRTQLSGQQNLSLHYSAMGGFFMCVREMSQRGHDVESSLPTVDTDGDYISPLSESEEEGSEADDIKVVERKCFVAPSKARSRQTWCNQVKQQRRRADDTRQETTRGRQCKALHKTPAQCEEEPEGLHAAASLNGKVEETPSLSGHKAGPPAPQLSDELEFNERHCMDNQSHDDAIRGPEERDTPVSKRKKKKRNKYMSAAENVGQEVNGNSESDVRVEDSVFSVSCDVENNGNKRKRSGEDDEEEGQLPLSAVAEPLNADVETQKKKKKRKKEKRVVVREECEEEEAPRRTLDLPPMSTGQLKEPENGSEDTAASQQTLETGYVKRKKHKKKQQSFCNAAMQEGQEGVDVSFCNGAVTLEESTGMSVKKKKKKKKTISEGVDVSYTPENEDDTQKTKEELEEQNAEAVTKKKKKKKSEISSRNISEDSVAQSDDSVSLQKKEKKRSSSFLFAEAEENNAQTRGENSVSQSVDAHVWGAQRPGVSVGDYETESAEMAGNLEGKRQKKKRKRKLSLEQDGVEKDHKHHFEEPNETCQSALTITNTGMKRKRKCEGNESELVASVGRVESAADAGHSPSDEAVVLKKKKKKKHKDKISCDSSPSDHLTQETLNMVERASPSPEKPGHQALNGVRHKKKKKKNKSTDNVLLEGKTKGKERDKKSDIPNIILSSPMLSETSLSKSEMASSDHIVKSKRTKVKRRLLDPCEDFLTDY